MAANGSMAFDASSLPWSETVSRAFPSRAMTAAGSPRHADAEGWSIHQRGQGFLCNVIDHGEPGGAGGDRGSGGGAIDEALGCELRVSARPTGSTGSGGCARVGGAGGLGGKDTVGAGRRRRGVPALP